jgi:LacI family transcriptional regulator
VSQRSRPKLADVAERAGVSLKTASRALNGEYGLAPATAEKVLAAARELGFRPNLLARSLASGRPSVDRPDHRQCRRPVLRGAHRGVERALALATRFRDREPNDDPSGRSSCALWSSAADALLVTPAPGDASGLRDDIDHGLVGPLIAHSWGVRSTP